MKKIEITIITLTGIFITFLVTLLLCFTIKSSIAIKDNVEAYSYNTSWQVEYLEDTSEVSFPSSIKTKYNDKVIITNTLPKLSDEQYIYIHTNYQSLEVYVGEEEKQVFGKKEFKIIRINNSNPWSAIKLDQADAEKEIKIVIYSSGSKKNIEIYDVLIGQMDAISFYLLSDSIPILLATFALLILAFLLLITGITITRRSKTKESLYHIYLSFFIIYTALWIFTDSNIQGALFIDNNYYSIINLLVFVNMPVPFMFVAKHIVNKKGIIYWIPITLVALVMIYIIISMLTGTYSCALALSMSHVSFVASILIYIYIVATEYYKNKSIKNLISLISLLVLVITGTITMILFYTTITPDNTNIFRYGVYIYSIILSVQALRNSIMLMANKENIDKLRISEEEYRIAVSHSDKYIIRYDIEKSLFYQQEETAKHMGTPLIVSDVPNGEHISEIVQDDSKKDFYNMIESINKGSKTGSTVLRIKDGNDRFGWYHFDYTTIFNNHNKPTQAIISFHDVTEIREKELAFQMWRQTYQTLTSENMNYYEFNLIKGTLDNQEGNLFNPIPSSIKELNEAIKYFTDEYIKEESRKPFLDYASRPRLLRNYERGIKTSNMEFLSINKGEEKWILASIQLINDPYSSDVKGYLLIQDIDKQKRTEELLNKRSITDPLTGLLNRMGFIEQVNEVLKVDPVCSIVMLDLDGFKQVNDVFGHQFGDEVIIDVSNILKHLLRADDLVCRIGGDEFILCLRNIDLSTHIGKKKIDYISKSLVNYYGLNVSVSSSFGIAIFPKDGKQFEELYSCVDKALHIAKHTGKNKFVYYDKSILTKELNSINSNHSQLSSTKSDILIIADDDSISRQILKEIFKDDFKIFEATNGKDVISLINEYGHSIAAILLDLVMPEMDGFEVIKKVRSDIFYSSIPIVTMSAFDEYEYATKTLELGASSFVSKPIDKNIIRMKIRDAISSHIIDEENKK